MHRFNHVLITLFAASCLAIACQPKTETEPPPDTTMPAADDSSQEPMPTETPTEAEEATEPEATPTPEAPKELAAADKTFVEDAAAGGMFEVQLGQFVVGKAKKQAIKDFAQKMVDEHGKANEELKGLAATKNVQLPTEMKQEHKDIMAKMEKLTGSKLEKEYAKVMVDDHTKDVQAFKDYSQSGTDPEVKDWAGKMVPILEEHLAHAQALKAGKTYKPKSDAQASAHSHDTATAKSATKTPGS